MLARPATPSTTRPDRSLRRAMIITGIIVLWMIVIILRLVQLQISQHDKLAQRAQQQQQGQVASNVDRGQLLDRYGKELARSVDLDSIFLAPDEVCDVEQTARGLADALNLDRNSLTKEINQAIAHKRRFLWITRRIESEPAARVAALDLRGVHVQVEPKRFYPNGGLAAHLLGFVGLDNKGLGGVEQFYNQKISGEAGKRLFEQDARGQSYD